MADAFISYSRQDADFVRRLAAELQERGKEVWVDENGIRDSEVFPDALRRAIEASDAFVFVISPDSVRSDYCEQEVAHAAELNKRIVPVALRPVADGQIPEPVRVRSWIPTDTDPTDRILAALDADLEWERRHTRLTLRAVEWDAAGRERSLLLRGADLAAAEAWLRGSATRDPGPTVLEQSYVLTGRQAAARRQRSLLAASLVVSVIAVGLLVFALISRGQAVSAQAVAKSRALAAESQTALSSDPELSILLGIQAARASATPQAMYALREAIVQSPVRRRLPPRGNQDCDVLGFDQAPPALAYSPSGRQIAEVACDGEVVIVDDATGRVRKRVDVARQAGQADAVAFSPDGHTLAVASGNGITLLNPATGKVLQTLTPVTHKPDFCTPGSTSQAPGSLGPGCPAGVGALGSDATGNFLPYCAAGPIAAPASNFIPGELAFSPDGTTLAGSDGFNLDIWRVHGNPDPRVVGGSGCIEGIAFSPSGAQILAGNIAAVDVYDAASGRLLGVRTVVPGGGAGEYTAVGRLALSPNGRYLAVAIAANEHHGSEVELFSAAPWRRLTTIAFSAHPRDDLPIAALAFSPDSTQLAIGAGDGTAGIWSVATGHELLPLSGHTAQITSIAWRPDGGELATASADGEGLVWRSSLDQGTTIATGAGLALAAANVRGDRVWGALASPTPGLAVLRSWTTAGVPVAGGFQESGQPSGYAAISQDARFGMLVDQDQRVVVRDLANGRTIGEVSQAFPVTSLSLAGGRVAVGLSSGDAALYDVTPAMQQLATGSTTGPLCGGGAYVAISADGQRAAAVGWCGGGVLWNAQTGQKIETFDTGVQAVSGVSLSPDGGLLAVSSLTRTTTLFDLATGRVLHVLGGDTGPVTGVAFSPTGTWLATASQDDDVRIWDPTSGQLLQLLPEGASVTSVTFTPSGQEVVSTDSLGRIHIQDACSPCGNASALLRLAATRVTRALTPAERQAYGA